MSKDHIILTGFMGSGKTSVGQLLAHKLNLPFVDLDHLIEQDEGRSIREIFQTQGEETFRKLESKAIHKALAEPRSVIATGGGALMIEENTRLLKQRGQMVYLQAEPETLWERVQWNDDRPLLEKHSTLEAFSSLLQSRIPNYKQSHFIIDVDHLTLEEVALCIMELVAE
ncbi:shikimate kinase [Chrysiogenes arsenatis]|uniref:shikimate kinase n=1 Tax=Chrysiogenes arsenatis TaxID=309797 RepID=UPI00040BDB48|nr:shikimate kinase [Chrysiogenes arsenatis]